MKTMKREMTVISIACVALLAAPRCQGEDELITSARRQISAHSPVLLQMVDRASIVAHVVVTNLNLDKYYGVTGNRACTLACSVTEMIKGPTNETSLLVRTWLKWSEHKRFAAGTNYIVFITSQTGERDVVKVHDRLTDHWLGIQPYDKQLMAELRTLFDQEQPSRRRTERAEQLDKSKEEDVKVKIE